MPGTHGFYARGTHGFFVRGSHGFRGEATECTIVGDCRHDEWTSIYVVGSGWAGTPWSALNGTFSTDVGLGCQGNTHEAWAWAPDSDTGIFLYRYYNVQWLYPHPNIWVMQVEGSGPDGNRLYGTSGFESPTCDSPDGIEVDFSGITSTTSGTPPAEASPPGIIRVYL